MPPPKKKAAQATNLRPYHSALVGPDESDIVEDNGGEFIVGVKKAGKQFCDFNNPEKL